MGFRLDERGGGGRRLGGVCWWLEWLGVCCRWLRGFRWCWLGWCCWGGTITGRGRLCGGCSGGGVGCGGRVRVLWGGRLVLEGGWQLAREGGAGGPGGHRGVWC